MDTKRIIEHFLLESLDTPYRWGGNSKIQGGYDCSGFTCEYLKIIGHLENRTDLTAHGIMNYLTHRGWITSMVPGLGDVLLFGSKKRIRHCAVALNDQLMVEAGGGDRETKSLRVAAGKNARVRIRPIDMRKDFYLCLSPPSTLSSSE